MPNRNSSRPETSKTAEQPSDDEALRKSRAARAAAQAQKTERRPEAEKPPSNQREDAAEDDDERLAPRLAPVEVGSEGNLAACATPRFVSLFPFTDEHPVVVINYGPMRHYGMISIPRTVRAVAVTVANQPTWLTEFDVHYFHERRQRPMIRLNGTTGEMQFSKKNGRMRAAGFIELSRWLQLRGVALEITLPSYFSSTLSFPDQVRQLLCGKDPGPVASEVPARPVRTPISLVDAQGQEYEMMLFSGVNMVIGEQGSGKTLVLSALARQIGVIPRPFAETGPAARFGYGAGFIDELADMLRSQRAALDNARYVVRLDNTSLMTSGWSAAAFELFLAVCQDLERRGKLWLLGLNPMTFALPIAKLFRGTASTVIETSPIADTEDEEDTTSRRRGPRDPVVRERVFIQNEDVFIPIRYATRRVAARPLLTGLVFISRKDIAFGKKHGLIGREDLDTLASLDETDNDGSLNDLILDGAATATRPLATPLGANATAVPRNRK